MNFKYYFPTLVLTGIFFLCSCGHHNDPSAPDDPSPLHISRPDSAYIYSIDEDSVETLAILTYYTYDAYGNMTFQFDSIIEPLSIYSATKRKFEMQYDEKGNIIVEQKSTYYPMSESWENGHRVEYEYDTENKLSIKTISYDDNLEKKIVYTWIDDEHASGLSYKYDRYAPDLWVLTERLEYTYNTQGKIIKNASFISFRDQKEERPWVSNTYEYDKYNNLVLHISVDYQRGGSSSESYKYEYDANGKMLISWCGRGNSKVEDVKYIEKCVYFY